MAASASCVRRTGTRGRRTRLRRGHGSEENRVRRCWLEKPCERRTDRSGPCRWLGSVMRMRALKADVIPQRVVDTASEGTLDFRRSFCRLHIDIARARARTHTHWVCGGPALPPALAFAGLLSGTADSPGIATQPLPPPPPHVALPHGLDGIRMRARMRSVSSASGFCRQPTARLLCR